MTILTERVAHGKTTTVIVPGDAPTTPEVRRSVGVIRRTDMYSLVGSAAASIALTTWLFTQLRVFQGALGFVAVAFLLFLSIYSAVVRFDETDLAVRDRIVAVLVHAVAFVLPLVLVIVVVYTFGRGTDALSHLNFFTHDMSQTGPLDPITSGGIIHAAVGTLIMITMALAISIPLGIASAVFLSEFPGRFSRLVRTVVEAMTALPSIVAGLFVYATIILTLGFERSGFAASLAITVMMLPIIIRSADVVLRLVPGNLKEASLALGSTKWRTVWSVTLPTARSGLTTAVILGTARGIGETSPVLLTAGLTTYLNVNPFSGPMVSLPLATFSFVKSPEPSMISRGFGSAAVLMVLVLVLFLVARLIGGRGPGVLTERQRKRRTTQSRQDAYRFRARELGIAGPGTSRRRERRGRAHTAEPERSAS
ncbi:phosphate ABC transporter permease PstA [Galbitalea soli]|nr:phosphate ABC transporter permease PstA [Galbitalea soli]NYJ31517.1 phosphate transport system permease protein [Galbitalea soli]